MFYNNIYYKWVKLLDSKALLIIRFVVIVLFFFFSEMEQFQNNTYLVSDSNWNQTNLYQLQLLNNCPQYYSDHSTILYFDWLIFYCWDCLKLIVINNDHNNCLQFFIITSEFSTKILNECFWIRILLKSY